MKKLFSVIVIIACAFGFGLNVQAEDLTGNIVLGPELEGGATITSSSYDEKNNISSITVTLTMNEDLLNGALNQKPGPGAKQGIFYVGLTPEKYKSYKDANGKYTFKKNNMYALKGNAEQAQAAIDKALAASREQAGYDTSVPTWIIAGYTQFKNETGWNYTNTEGANGSVSNRDYILNSLGAGNQLTYGSNYRLQMLTGYDWYMVYYVDNGTADLTDDTYDIIKVSYEIKYPITGYNEDKAVAIYYPSLEMALENSKEIDINDDITFNNSLAIRQGTTLNINKNMIIDGSFVIPEGTTLNINKDAILTINADAELTINTSQVVNNGKVINNGTISGTKVDASALEEIKIPENYVENCTEVTATALTNLLDQKQTKVDLSILYQNDFNSYVDSVKAAVDALVYLDADYAKVDAAKDAIPSDLTIYTKVSVNSLNSVLNKDLSGLKKPDQGKVDAYADEITAAIKNLELLADYSELKKVVATAEQKIASENYKDTTSLSTLLGNINYDLGETKQTTVTGYVTSINNAINALVLKDANYSKVNAAKAKIPSDLTGYTKVSVKSLNNVLNKNVSGKNILEQSIVDAYANEIMTAINNLVVLADYSKVDEALNKIPNDMSIYTDDSITLFNRKMNSINIDRDLSTNQQAIIIGYVNAINDAVDCLVEKSGDYSVVEAAIANIPADLSIYTDSSVDVLNTALNNVLRGLTISKQAIIIGYANAINDAVDALAIKATFSADEVNTKDDVKKVTIGVTDINTTENVLKDSLESSEYKDKENISVKLDVSIGNDFKVNTTIANKMSTALEKNIKNAKMVSFFDISINLYDNLTGKTIGKLSNLNDPVYLTIALPKEYRTVYSGYTRKYYVLRYHDGLISIINTSLTSDGKGLTFRSDKFSTYALAYVDIPTNSTGVTPPYTNDEINSNIILCGVSILGLCGSAIIYKRKKNI